MSHLVIDAYSGDASENHYLDLLSDVNDHVKSIDMTVDRGVDFKDLKDCLEYFDLKLTSLTIRQNYSMDGDDFLLCLKTLKLKEFNLYDEQSSFLLNFDIHDLFSVMPDNSYYTIKYGDYKNKKPINYTQGTKSIDWYYYPY